jgi:hypothetical protein
VGAPRNHFEPALVSIVEHERSVMTLVSPSYDSLSLTKTLCTLIRMSFSQANREAQAVRGPA